MTASGNNVVLTFATPQFTNLQSIAGTAMVPEHIWSSVSNPATFADPNPVGTGPFKLGSFTPQGFTLVKNPELLAGLPGAGPEGLLPGVHVQHRAR